MSQSNTIFAYLALAFVVFVTLRGELPVYMGFLLADPKQPAGQSTVETPTASAGKVASLGANDLSTAASALSMFL